MSAYEKFRKILNKVDDFSVTDLTDEKSKTYTFINPFSVKLLAESEVDISKFDKIFVDGILMVYLLKLLFKIKVRRYSFDFSSLANIVFQYGCENSLPMAFIGSDLESNRKFCKKIHEQYDGIILSFSRDGYFGEETFPELINLLEEKSTSLIVLGMGTPRQDELAIYLKSKLENTIIFTCGGFIHQYASTGNKSYYPYIIDKLNLRFLYRIYDEPKLLKRYMVEYPKSIFWIIKLFFRDKNV